ncbi:MAG: VanZ family protein [Bacteroidales bacterium]|nr:VanZ family protein [Bacteroidales bacterium]
MKDKFKKFRKNFGPAVIWGIFILILSGLPGSSFPKIPSFWEWIGPDKIIHLFIYGVFGYLLQSGFTRQFSEKKKRYYVILSSFGLGIIFGAITEVLQFYIFIGRNGNIFDFLANIIGCIIGISIYYLMFSKKNCKKNKKTK